MNPEIVPRLDAPCRVEWSSLPGDDRARYCDQCQLHVHNFSALTATEKHRFLADNSRRKCVAYPVRPGTIALGARPASQFYRVRKFSRWAAIPVLALLSLTGCATTEEATPPCPPPTGDGKQLTEDEDGKMILGGIMFEKRPLWKRILWPFN